MDALINDGINSNSVLENTRNAQKQYDVYSALDASIVSPDMALSVGVDVEIGEKSDDERKTILTGLNAGSNILSISNSTQAKVAPDLNELQSGQDINNRLQLVSSGLDNIKSSIDQLASQIKQGEDYSKNTVVQEAFGQINDIIENSRYAGKPIFTALADKYSISAFDEATVSGFTGEKYSAIQSTILASADSVAQNQGGITVTKTAETFVIANNNSETVFSFPKSTPLDKINQTILDVTGDSSTSPLVYFKRDNSAKPTFDVEEREPVQFAVSLNISSLEGQLFSPPLDTYAFENIEEVAEFDSSLSGMNDRFNERRARAGSEFAEGGILDGGKTDYVSINDDLVTRYKKANDSLGADRRGDDGFGVTPVNPGESSGSLTGGSELRDKAKSTNFSKNFDASGSNDDVMLLPEQGRTLPYVTLKQRESGGAGYGSLGQFGKKFQGGAQDYILIDEFDSNRTMFERENLIRGGGIFDQIQQIAEKDEYLFKEYGQESAQEIHTIDKNRVLDNHLSSFENNSKNSNLEMVREGDLFIEDKKNPNATYILNTVEQDLNLEKSMGNFSNNSYAEQTSAVDDLEKTEAQGEGGKATENTFDSQITDFSNKGRYIGTNPVKELESIHGVISQTLMFTLRGNIGAMDYVIAAGVSVDTLSLAINTTTSFTGVTANSANGRISLAGTISRQEVAMVGGIDNEGSSNFNNNGGEADFGQENNRNAFESSSNLQSIEENLVQDNSPANTFGLATLQSGIDLTDLGFARGRAGKYNLDTFKEKETPEELVKNPQLARRIISNAYKSLDIIQNNIDSISSLNQRNTYDALEMVGRKILDKGVNEILSFEESEKILNNISVGISNSVSADGGRGFGDSPIASLNLLSNIDNVPLENYTQEPDNIQKNYLTERLNRYQSMFDYEDSAINFDGEQKIRYYQENSTGGTTTQLELSKFEENITDARARLQELQDIYEIGGQNREDYREIIQRAEDRYFTNIEDVKLTIRELGRVLEREDSDKEIIEKGQSAKLFDERQAQLENAGVNNLFSVDGLTINQDGLQSQSAEIEGNVQNAGSRLNGTQNYEKFLVGYTEFLNRNTNELTAPAVGMDSLTTRPAVAVTSSAQGETERTDLFENGKYKSVVKLFEDKIGTVMVHGQGYTINDLEGSFVKMLESEPEVVKSVLDKALEDIDAIRNDIADLQTQELEYAGDALLAAITMYGSDLSADNPEGIKRSVAN